MSRAESVLPEFGLLKKCDHAQIKMSSLILQPVVVGGMDCSLLLQTLDNGVMALFEKNFVNQKACIVQAMDEKGLRTPKVIDNL